MNWTVLFAEQQTLLAQAVLLFTLVLGRVGGLLMTAPMFSSLEIPMQVRALLAVAVSLIVAPLQWSVAPAAPESLVDAALLVAGEMLVGVALGLGVMILLSGMQVAGQVIGQLSGMSLAEVFDPGFNDNAPVFSQFLFHLAVALFVLLGGHRMALVALLDTFQALPPGAATALARSPALTDVFTLTLGQSFALGVRVAAPVMAALLIATIVLGLISRAMPQLNILVIGFVVSVWLTLAAMTLAIEPMAMAFDDYVEPLMETLFDAFDGEASSAGAGSG
ncbi:MAG: flagellar biosynthetic protein FliR [Pirellulales bacterium]